MTATSRQRAADEPASPAVHVYSAEPALVSPCQLLADVAADLRASRELTARLLRRNLAARYRQTLLGYVWLFLAPLGTTLIFLYLSRSGVLRTGELGVPYALYVLVGTLVWQAFADMVQKPVEILTASVAMLTKVNFPREALVLVAIGEVLFAVAVRSLLLIPVMLFYDVPLGPTTLLSLVGLACLLLTGLAIGVLLVPIGLLFRDVVFALPLLLTFWMLLTPVAYTPRAGGLVSFNPATPLVVCTRSWLLGIEPTGQIGPLVLVAGVTLTLLAGAWLLYRVAMPHLIARVGA